MENTQFANIICNLPELVTELLEREAAMLMALERREAGMVDCPARDWTVAAPTCCTVYMYMYNVDKSKQAYKLLYM